MSLAGLLGVIADDPELRRAIEYARGAGRAATPAHETGADVVAPAALRPFVVAALALPAGLEEPGAGLDGPGVGLDAAAAGSAAAGATATRFVLAVTATGREAEDLTAALASLLPPHCVACFPAWETLPHERLSPRSDTVGQRLAVLRRLAHPDPAAATAGAEDGEPATGPLQVVVAPVRSLLQPIVAGLGDIEPIRLRPGDEADLEEVLTRLVEAGYTRTDLVENRGDIAVRGGILDVFPPIEEHPLRIEFFGDTVEEIRYFKVADQRSLQTAP